MNSRDADVASGLYETTEGSDGKSVSNASGGELKANSSSNTESTTSYNAKNPFNEEARSKREDKTRELLKFPFKTLNRIVDDIKWTIPYKLHYGSSILSAKPFDYAHKLASIVASKQFNYNLIILNNHLKFCPSSERIEIGQAQRSLAIVRGLLVNGREVLHVRISLLDTVTNPFVTEIPGKHEYHVVPITSISEEDLELLGTDNDNTIDVAFFKCSSGPINKLFKVSIYSSEFSETDLHPLIDQDLIRERYLRGVKAHPNLNLSEDVIPNSIHCFKTLIRALKGPVLLNDEELIKTISLRDTVLDSQIDIGLLIEKLHFRLNETESELIPPNLNKDRSLREAYVRKIQELIYLARIEGKSVQNNEFVTQYSYADNASMIFNLFNEFDKHISMTHFSNDNSSYYDFNITLSVFLFFQDELIIKCYENTVLSDPKNKMHYVDALKNIMNMRNSSASNNKLRSYYQNMSFKGEMIGYNDYINALKNIGIPPDQFEEKEISADSLIAMYQSRYRSDPKNYVYYNNNLRTIAKVLSSEILNKFIQNEVLPLNIAMDELNIEEITEDEVVITAYEFKLDDVLQMNGFKVNDTTVLFLHKALLSVAVYRRSYILLNYIETKIPDVLGESGSMSSEEALGSIGASSSASDFEIISKFQQKIVDAKADEILVLRDALRVIAEGRKSEILVRFLKNGKLDTSLLPSCEWPAGLDNVGNTCYLNSLLQYYFCIKPLRSMILEFSESMIDYSQHTKRKIGGRDVEDSEIKRSIQFIYHLQELFEQMISTEQKCVQPSKELVYLSFLPLSQPVAFKDERDVDKLVDLDGNNEFGDNSENAIVISSKSPSPDTMAVEQEIEDVEMLDDPIISEPQNIHPESQEPGHDKSTGSSRDKKMLSINHDQIESTIEIGRQQDVTECIENVTFQIETALGPEFLEKDGEQYDLIKKLFYGKTKQTIFPLKKGSEKRITIERFFSLIINVGDHPRDIYDSLDNYFGEDIVNLEESSAKKSLTILELPEVLQFHVQRVLFDRERLMPYKSIEPIPFSDRIYLDRYLDTEDPEMLKKRNEVFSWKSEINDLLKKRETIIKPSSEQKLSLIDSLMATKQFLEAKVINHESLHIELSTILALQKQIDDLKNELQVINSSLNELYDCVSHQFDPYKKIGYSVFAIFIHRGEASYGHYWIYIKDPNKNIYRKYNDELVTEVPASEIFNFIEGNTATPYYIVYVKESLEREYVEPLKRVINKCI